MSVLKTLFHEPIIGELCPTNAANALRLDFNDENLYDIANTLRRIMDDISIQYDCIDQIPLHSSRKVFERVCVQIFSDGDLNWGRVVALFYFAYRLTVPAFDRSLDNISWVREMLTWAGDLLVRYVAGWVLRSGGWKMIKGLFGPSNKTWMMLCGTSIALGLWFYFRKN